jgi:L-lysine exporter family protein LysE/ArgO
MFNSNVFLSAAALSASQVVGIGPQNAYVIRQGLARQHIVPIIALCILFDIVLISLGVLGLGRAINAIPGFSRYALLASALLIGWLGLRALRAALAERDNVASGMVAQGRSAAIGRLLLVTWLNPYVWFDTVVIIGGVSAACAPADRPFFIAGSALASALWFLTLGILSGRLAPWFERPHSWRLLDGGVAAVMFLSAASMLWRFSAT